METAAPAYPALGPFETYDPYSISMMTDIEHTIIESMARTLWVCAYMDAYDRGDLHRLAAQEAGYRVRQVSPDEGGGWRWEDSDGNESGVVFVDEDDAWRDAAIREGIAPEGAGPGEEWRDHVPAAPPRALHLAYYYAGKIALANHGNLFWLVRKAAEADGYPTDEVDTLDGRRHGSSYLEEFGHCIMMQCQGHGVSWFDDHERFLINLPLCETPMVEDLGYDIGNGHTNHQP